MRATDERSQFFMISGEWTVDGSAADLRVLSARLRATGQSGLKRNIAKAIRVATLPAREAVKQELLDVMPKEGGANVYLATRIRTTSAVLTGAKSAGVVVRSKRKGSDLVRMNATGRLRHPVFGNRDAWADTDVPAGWFEKTLAPFGEGVHEALVIAQNATAREAGFI